MRSLLAVTLLGVVGLALAAILGSERRAFTLGVAAGGPAVVLEPGDGVCQGTIDVPPGGDFDEVRMILGTYGRPGPELEVTVIDAELDPLAEGSVAAGYPDVQERPFHDVRVGRVAAEQAVEVCVANRGDRRVAIYGNTGLASRSTAARTVEGAELDADLDLVFLRSRAVSRASLLPDMFRRASLFRPEPFGSWAYWALLGALALLVPLGLARALRAAAAEPDPPDQPPSAGEPSTRS